MSEVPETEPLVIEPNDLKECNKSTDSSPTAIPEKEWFPPQSSDPASDKRKPSLAFPVGIPKPLLLKYLVEPLPGKHSSTQKAISSLSPKSLLPPQPRIDNAEMFISIFNEKDGKDKIIKIIQYSMKLVIWADTKKAVREYMLPNSSNTSSAPGDSKSPGKRKLSALTYKAIAYLILVKWSRVLSSQFSMFRKIIRFGNWMEPFHEVYHSFFPKDTSSAKQLGLFNRLGATLFTKSFAEHVIELYNAVFDDAYLLAKFGLLKFKNFPQFPEFAESHANYAWITSIFLALGAERTKMWKQWDQYLKIREREVELLEKRGSMDPEKTNEADLKNLRSIAIEKYKISEARRISWLNTLKLLCDMTFCGLELLHLDSRVSPLVPTGAGLGSAFIGFYKIYHGKYQKLLFA